MTFLAGRPASGAPATAAGSPPPAGGGGSAGATSSPGAASTARLNQSQDRSSLRDMNSCRYWRGRTAEASAPIQIGGYKWRSAFPIVPRNRVQPAQSPFLELA